MESKEFLFFESRFFRIGRGDWRFFIFIKKGRERVRYLGSKIINK